jgi:nicotinamidase-related amidase
VIDPTRVRHAALLINECQNGMTDPALASREGLATEVERRGMIEHIARLADAFRGAGRPVVHCTIVPLAGYVGFTASCLLLGSLKKAGQVVAGNPAADIHPGLTPVDGDIVIERHQGLTPFHETQLDPILRNLGVDTVVVTGVSTNIGVPGVCLEAVNRGLQAVVPEDCTAGAWPEAHEFQVTHTLPLLATVTSSDEVIAGLGQGDHRLAAAPGHRS